MNTVEAIKMLEGLVKYLARLYDNDKNIMMSAEDIESELMEEIVKGMKYYQGKGMPDEDLKNYLKRMCYNRISELRYRYYVTFRKTEVSRISLDVEAGIEITTPEDDPAAIYDSSLRVSDTYNTLSSDAAKLIFEIIIMKKSFGASTQTDSKVYNHMRVEDIAAATGLCIKDAAVGIREIREVYAKVVQHDN